MTGSISFLNLQQSRNFLSEYKTKKDLEAELKMKESTRNQAPVILIVEETHPIEPATLDDETIAEKPALQHHAPTSVPEGAAGTEPHGVCAKVISGDERGYIDCFSTSAALAKTTRQSSLDGDFPRKPVNRNSLHPPVRKLQSLPSNQSLRKDFLCVPTKSPLCETSSLLGDCRSLSDFDGRSHGLGDDSRANGPHQSTQSLHIAAEKESAPINDVKSSLPHTTLKRTLSVPLKLNSKIMHSKDDSNSTAQLRRETLAQPAPHTSRFSLLSPKFWKSSFADRLGEDKKIFSASRFSLRQSFHRPIRSSWYGREGEVFLPRGRKKPRQRYRLVEAKTGQMDGVSLEVVGKTGTYLRVKGNMLVADKDSSESYFSKECTFVPLPDMWFAGFFAFESVSKPSHFIRLTDDEELVLDRFDGSVMFKEEASFQLKRKPCATCLQTGVHTWTKTSNGEYRLGKVIAIDDHKIHIKFEGEKVIPYSKTRTNELVPDIVPGQEELPLGCRVIAQRLHRDTFYPGVISGVRSDEDYELLFDDGGSDHAKASQIRVLKSYLLKHHGSGLCHFRGGSERPLESRSWTSNSPFTRQEVSGVQESDSDRWQCPSGHAEDEPVTEEEERVLEFSWSSSSLGDPAKDRVPNTCETEVLPSSENAALKESRTLIKVSEISTQSRWEVEGITQDSGCHGDQEANLPSHAQTTVDSNAVSGQTRLLSEEKEIEFQSPKEGVRHLNFGLQEIGQSLMNEIEVGMCAKNVNSGRTLQTSVESV